LFAACSKTIGKIDFFMGIVMKINYGMVCVVLLSSHVMFARLEVLDNTLSKVKLLSTEEMRFCYISFVKINGTKYIIKQKKSNFIRKIVGVVRDSITAHVAENFGSGLGLDADLAHRVDVISAGEKFPGKRRKDWPATIHTIAPGKMVKAQDTRYNSMNIKQADIGFRRDMLVWMAKHELLIMMVALDTFLCNHDRHRGNLFYTPSTDSFCAIDMDSAFKYNLCALACENFTKMINNRKLALSSKEIQVLTTYRKHLQFLIDNNHSEDTLSMYNYFAEKAGFVEGSDLYTERVAEELESNRAMIIQSYEDAKQLVKIVEQLIAKHTKA
jgi:hypothetical protein